MATVVWMSVFLLLIVELVITALLVLPLPRAGRRFLAKKVFTRELSQKLKTVSNFIFVGLVLAVADAVASLRHLEKKEHSDKYQSTTYGDSQSTYFTTSMDKQRKFRAERNMYLSSFALTLGFSLARLIELMQELVNVDEERDELRKKIAAMSSSAAAPQEQTSAVVREAPNGNPSDDTTDAPTTDISSGVNEKPLPIRRRANAATAKSD